MNTKDLIIITLATSALVFFLLLIGASNPIKIQNYDICEWTNLTHQFNIKIYEDNIGVYTGIPDCAVYGVAQSGLFPTDSKIIIDSRLNEQLFNKTLKHEKCHQKIFRGLTVPEGLTEEQFCIKESEK